MENVHVPDGMIARSEVFSYCQEYERQIRDAGGVDLQILGIGRTGQSGLTNPVPALIREPEWWLWTV